jgi:hypothetical protein
MKFCFKIPKPHAPQMNRKYVDRFRGVDLPKLNINTNTSTSDLQMKILRQKHSMRYW